MRPVVSYDDISAPQEPLVAETMPSPPHPQAKKRKTNQKLPGRRPQQHYQQHWDDPGFQAQQMMYDDASGTSMCEAEHDEHQGEEGEVEEDEESRDLTHDEIWDDSALVDAWDSAMAEYEAYHGPGKKWKEGPIKKSPLWYNVPPSDSKKPTRNGAPNVATTAVHHSAEKELHANTGADSTPLNFDTFVPSHDPSLASFDPSHPNPLSGSDYAQFFAVNPPPMVSQDEAFQRALAAMYWSGYWTAVYHCQRRTGETIAQEGDAEAEEYAGEYEEDEDMVPTQR